MFSPKKYGDPLKSKFIYPPLVAFLLSQVCFSFLRRLSSPTNYYKVRQLRQDHTIEITDPTGNKVTEERDVRIRDMIIADSPITTIADVIFGQQVLLIHLPLGAI